MSVGGRPKVRATVVVLSMVASLLSWAPPALAHTAPDNPYFFSTGKNICNDSFDPDQCTSIAGNVKLIRDAVPVSGNFTFQFDFTWTSPVSGNFWNGADIEGVRLEVRGLDNFGQPATAYAPFANAFCTCDFPTWHASHIRDWDWPYYEYRMISTMNGGLFAGGKTTGIFDPPVAPTNLAVAEKTQSSVDLTWSDNSGNETSFVVERRQMPTGGWGAIGSPTSNFYVDLGLKHSTTYEYRVKATNSVGSSDWSNTVSATTTAISADQLSPICTDTPYSISADACQGDPVKSGIGAYVTSVSDLSLAGFGVPLNFDRFYSSADTTDGVLGVGWTHSFAVWLNVQADGDVVFRTGNGQRLLFLKRPNGTFASDSGIYGALSQDESGYKYARRDQTSYRFDSNGRLLSQLDRNGNGLSFTYNIDGKLAVVSDAAGRTLTLAHNADGRVSVASLSDGRDLTYGYDASGRLSSVTDVRGGTTTYTYDASGRLKKITDQGGHVVVDNTYDSNGRVLEQLDGEGALTTFSWNPTTGTATMTDARGQQWKDVYQGNELIQRIDPLTNTVQFERDNRLNITKLTDARGHAWTMTYDDRGNMLTRTAPRRLASSRSSPTTRRTTSPATRTGGATPQTTVTTPTGTW